MNTIKKIAAKTAHKKVTISLLAIANTIIALGAIGIITCPIIMAYFGEWVMTGYTALSFLLFAGGGVLHLYTD